MLHRFLTVLAVLWAAPAFALCGGPSFMERLTSTDRDAVNAQRQQPRLDRV